ncbi:hypothetical protein ABEB36_014545 [Hypothenemus hampei]|uniref:HTH CENPB-type domain-containing protein n=1 Tax=Hypothenemus hampei TaxID=57062 RepID=A0ABD1E300_HYPHA
MEQDPCFKELLSYIIILDHLVNNKASAISPEAKLVGPETVDENVFVEDDERILDYEKDENNEYQGDESSNTGNLLSKVGVKLCKLVPLETKIKVVQLAKQHPKWHLRTLQAKGSRKLKSKDNIRRWERDILKGGTIFDKYAAIDSWTYDRFVESRKQNIQVTTHDLHEWALKAARQYQSSEFTFKASPSWVKRFKKKHKIRQQKSTEYLEQNIKK